MPRFLVARRLRVATAEPATVYWTKDGGREVLLQLGLDFVLFRKRVDEPENGFLVSCG